MTQLARLHRSIAFALFALVLSACAAMGVGGPTAPLTFDQKAIVAQGTVTTLRSTAAKLLDAKAISVNDAQNTLATTDAAAAGIVVARSMEGTNLAGANAKLLATTTILTALQTYLEAHQGVKP